MLLSKNEFLYLIFIVVGAIFLLLMFFLIMVVINVKMKKRKQIEMLSAVIATEENERKRIAEDMHDEIGPMLSAIKLQINAFVSSKTKEDLEVSVKETSVHLNEVIQNVRNIVRNLSPVKLVSHGLIQSIEDFRNLIEKNGRIKFCFMNHGITWPLREDAETNIYRIVSEMINNSLKHSSCNEIKLAFRMFEKKFIILYTDNGNQKPGEKSVSGGMGVGNIISRVGMLKGRICTKSDFNRGAFYYITLDNKNIVKSPSS